MAVPVRLLILSDSANEVTLMAEHLERNGYTPVHFRVDSLAALNSALDNQDWDLILHLHPLKSIPYAKVIALLREKWLEIPLLVLAEGADEKFAAEAMRAGANDCLNKSDPARLVPVLERELRDAEIRQEHRKAKRTIRTNEEFLRNIIETSLDGIIAINHLGRITLFNKSAQKLFQYQPGEARNQPFEMLLAPDNASGNTIAEYLGHEIGSTVRKEFTFKKKDGSTFEAEVAISIGKDENGFRMPVLYLHDITERRKIEQRLKQVQKMEAVGLLAGGVAHDFNNHLTIMLGYADMLKNKTDAGDLVREYAGHIKKAGEHAKFLTSQLLAFGRKQTLHPRIVNLNSMITEKEPMLKSLLGEDIKVSLTMDPHLKNLKVDPHQLEQILMNLVINARDAISGKCGNIIIKTDNVNVDETYCIINPEARPGNFIRLSIEDTGCGMDRKTIARIFEPFFSTKESAKGTGLGLSVVYGIIKQHNGWINVYSEPGHGSTFRIYLPASDSAQAEPEQQKLAFADARGNGERILLVEDEKSIKEFSANVLRTNGYQVYEASSLREARDIFQKQAGNFRLIFSDIVLPDGNALSLVDELSAAAPKISVLLTSGYMDHQLHWELLSKQGYRFLQKPYSIAELHSNIWQSLTQTQSEPAAINL